MRVTLSLPDDLFESLAKAAGSRPLDEEITSRLQRLLEIPTDERIVVLSGEDRKQLERILGDLPLKDGKDVVERAGKLARIEIGEVAVPFTLAQFAELKRRAEKRGKPVQEVVADTVRRMHESFFNTVRE